MHLKITSFTVTPLAAAGRTKGWKSPGAERSFHSTQLIFVFGKWANFHKRLGGQCIKQACMPTDNATKQKAAFDCLSVGALYVTVEGLQWPMVPRTKQGRTEMLLNHQRWHPEPVWSMFLWEKDSLCLKASVRNLGRCSSTSEARQKSTSFGLPLYCFSVKGEDFDVAARRSGRSKCWDKQADSWEDCTRKHHRRHKTEGGRLEPR